MTYQATNPVIVADVLALIAPEIRNATSSEDLQSRLAKLGYGYRDTPEGRKLTTLPHGLEIAAMPASF